MTTYIETLQPLLQPLWIFLAVEIAAVFLLVWARCLPLWRAGSAARPATKSAARDFSAIKSPDAEPLPRASVIVYSFVDEEELKDYLSQIMNQDYPDYEVIVVNEGNAESSTALAQRLESLYPNRLYVTFIPPQTHNLSRRKLAQTIGIKAASGDVVITTLANCDIPSEKWISTIMTPFAEYGDIDVVLGYSHIDYDELHGVGKTFRATDATLTACQWIGAAASGHPYRGDGTNLAYRKRLFFDNKGYSASLHLMNGDDDIFLNQIMDDSNTAVAVNENAILTQKWDSAAGTVLSDLKERYIFTSRFLPKAPFLRAGFASCMQWLLLLAGIAAIVVSFVFPSPVENVTDFRLYSAGAALLILLGGWLSEILIYRRAAKRLETPGGWWMLPMTLLCVPINNFFFRQRLLRHRRAHYSFE